MGVLTARYDLIELVEMIDEPNRSRCRKLLLDNRKLFRSAYGSTHNHQNWSGGYWDHISEVMNIAAAMYRGLNSYRPLSFSLSDSVLILFLHDIEKPWKYEFGPDGRLRTKEEFNTEKKSHAFRDAKLQEYGIVLTPEQQNAMKYVHGEGKDYSSKRRVMNPLAAFCHMADTWSARGWFNHPGDPWPGAKRVRS